MGKYSVCFIDVIPRPEEYEITATKILAKKRTMQNNLRKADNQSQRIVIDLRRCKMNERRAVSRLKYELTRAHRVEKLLVISKAGKVLEIK